MPPNIWNTEFLNSNAQRSYPLADDATETDLSGSFVLPKSFIVGLDLPIHASLLLSPDKFFIRSITVNSGGFGVAIAYDDETASPPTIATALVTRAAHIENASYALVGFNVPGEPDLSFDDTLGKITFGRLVDLDKQPAGQFFFDYEGGKLDPDCIRPMIRAVSSLRVINGTEESERLYGDIKLVAGANIRLTPILVSGQDPQIRIDAITGEGLIESCDCGTEVDTAEPIRTINNVSPAIDGNLTLVGNTCMEITATEHGLILRDTCSQPCCGCEELEKITQDMGNLGVGARTLEAFTARLQAEVTKMSGVVLGSKLNDSGCLTC